jgi:hypothetical protein
MRGASSLVHGTQRQGLVVILRELDGEAAVAGWFSAPLFHREKVA